MDETDAPFDPSSTIVGGPPPPYQLPASSSSPASKSKTGASGLAWIAGGLILLLLLAFAGIILWFRESKDNQQKPAVVAPTEAAALIRTTPLAEANLVLQFEDDFSASDSGWDDSFGKSYTKQYGNNKYHIEITTNNLVVWGLANRNAADFDVEVEATLEGGGEANTYGLIFRYIDPNNYYRFDVSGDGYFLLTKFHDEEWTTLVDWTQSDALNQGQSTNVLKISAFGPKITIYANGQELASVSDGDFLQGNFGFFASTFTDSHIWVSFDNLKLWGPAQQEIAIIPTIFSIAEDALFSVPQHLVRGSLALGATRWQTMTSVVLPAASPGIFSAVMMGFGRAVGETMIVLMATGNTPLMDMSIFQGMRTLAANIAVEVPEAEVFSTHYRVLFLAALILFLFTFVFNTLAEIIRHRLRKRYSGL